MRCLEVAPRYATVIFRAFLGKTPGLTGGVPLPKKLYGMPTRVVPAQAGQFAGEATT